MGSISIAILSIKIINLDYIEYLLDHTPKSANGTFSKRLGKLFLLLYNTVQITLEILLIVLVTCNYSFWWKGNSLKVTHFVKYYLA